MNKKELVNIILELKESKKELNKAIRSTNDQKRYNELYKMLQRVNFNIYDYQADLIELIQ